MDVFCARGDPAVARWVKEEEFGKKMVDVARQLCEYSLSQKDGDADDIEASWQLLTFGMSTDQKFGKWEPVSVV